MKIRINGNSVRIRLSRTETALLEQEGYLEERTEFGGGTFIYALQSKEALKNLEASLEQQKITMYVPKQFTNGWPGNEVVGFDHKMDIGNGKQLYLLLEKDFKCIDTEVTEDQSDNYEHPLKSC